MEGTRIALALPAPPIINRKSAKAAVGSRQQTQMAAVRVQICFREIVRRRQPAGAKRAKPSDTPRA